MDRDIENYPKAYVISSTPIRGAHDPNDQITIDCPLCGHLHYHGAAAGARGLVGHRVAHCWSPYVEANIKSGVNSYMIYDNRP